MADGDTLLYVGGSKTSFRCSCGSNVFQKHHDRDLGDFYICNGCGAEYSAKEDDPKMKVNNPFVIRETMEHYRQTGEPDVFTDKQKRAVVIIYEKTLKDFIREGDKPGDMRYLVWGWVLGLSDGPFRPLGSDDITPPEFNALGRWATYRDQATGQYLLRPAFSAELSWVLTMARIAELYMKSNPGMLFGDILSKLKFHLGADAIDVDDRNISQPENLPSIKEAALQLGGLITADNLPAPEPAKPEPIPQVEPVSVLNIDF